MVSSGTGRPGVNRKLCSSSHSDTNPPSGGSPALASTPSNVSQPTQGMVRIRPPSLPRLRSEVACSTLPVPRKSRLLKQAWLATWYSVAVSASAAIGSMS
ncbi:hypothetical protein D9M68_613630 [compost metagenome]